MVLIVSLYGAFFVFDAFSFKSIASWPWLKVIGVCWGFGLVALALEFLLRPFLSPVLRNDQSADPLWKRAGRALAIIVLFSVLFVAIAYVQQ